MARLFIIDLFSFFLKRGARHGIKMNGKLARIEEQEKLEMEALCSRQGEETIEKDRIRKAKNSDDDNDEKKKIKKHKKHKKQEND